MWTVKKTEITEDWLDLNITGTLGKAKKPDQERCIHDILWFYYEPLNLGMDGRAGLLQVKDGMSWATKGILHQTTLC